MTWQALYHDDEMPGWHARELAAWRVIHMVSRPVELSAAPQAD